MANSRVEKHKEYRTSLIKEGTSVLNSPRDKMSSSSSQTLPFDTVMESVNAQNKEVEEVKKQLKKKYLIYSGVVVGIVIAISIICIIAVVLFKR